MHTYTPTDSIFDGHVTNLFSNLSLLLLVFRVSMAVKGLITVVEVGGWGVLDYYFVHYIKL